MQNNTSIKKEYWHQQVITNNRYYIIICTFTFLIETLLLINYSMIQTRFTIANIEYLYFLGFGMVLPLLFVCIFMSFQKKNIFLNTLHLLFLILLLLWACLFATFELSQGNNSYVFTYTLIMTSAGIRLPSRLHCSLNFGAILCFYVSLFSLSINEKLVYEKMIDSVIIYVLCTIIILYSNKLLFNQYKMRNAIEEKNKRLHFLANYDELLKIPNRRMVFNYLEELMENPDANLCCILIDVDDFKKYNDTYGHMAGDHLLVHIASILKKTADKHYGLTGRYGGEEFLFILPECTEKEVHSIMQEILQTISGGQSKDYISISAGGCMRQPDSSVESLILNADTAMYQVKCSGKNNFLMYTYE